jgi:hypothetical protein
MWGERLATSKGDGMPWHWEVRENFYMDPESEMKRKDWDHSSIGHIALL